MVEKVLETQVIINEDNGKLFVSSRDIAVGLRKQHHHVTDKIKEVLDVAEYCEIDFVDEKNRTYKEYLLDKDAFILLIMNYGGFVDFKRAYIKRFNEMENIIKENSLQTTKKEQYLSDIYGGGIPAIEATRMLVELEMKPLQAQIEVMKPKQIFYDDVIGSDTACDMSTVAKVLIGYGLGRNKIFELLRNNHILRKNNEPYQKYIDSNWFRVVESKYTKLNGDIQITFKTVVFQKGIDGISKLLEKLGYRNATKQGILSNYEE